MSGVEKFLGEAVFYPCSGLDGAPIRFLAKRFPCFVYADYRIDREMFFKECRQPGLRGYRVGKIRELEFQLVFGKSWNDIRRAYSYLIGWLPFELKDPFVATAQFQLLPGYGDDHGPPAIDLIFACCEAFMTFHSVFSQRGITPRCLAYIRSGIGFGGNYSQFPHILEKALRANRAGLPEFMLYDDMGCNPGCGDYLNLTSKYAKIQYWDYETEGYGRGNVVLAKRKNN